jgi:hypothetical protein
LFLKTNVKFVFSVKCCNFSQNRHFPLFLS